MYSKRTGILSVMTGTCAVFIIGLLLLLLKQWRMGIKGVIYVMIIVGTVKIIAGFVISRRYFQIRFKMGDLGLIALAISVSALLIHFISIGRSILLSTLINLSILSLVSFVTIKWAKIESIKQFFLVKER